LKKGRGILARRGTQEPITRPSKNGRDNKPYQENVASRRHLSIGNIYIYIYIHTYIHTYILTYLHTYIHTYIYIYSSIVHKLSPYHAMITLKYIKDICEHETNTELKMTTNPY
jgi:hypothetical protein